MTPRTVLLTLGRLPKALTIARALAEAGRRVIIAEPFAWHLSRASRFTAKSYQVCAPNSDGPRYADDLLAIIERERVGLIVPISEEILHASSIQPRLPTNCRFFGVEAAHLIRLHNKRAFAERAAELGLSVPETANAAAPEAAHLTKRFETVFKPIFTSSGKGLRYLKKGDAPPQDVSAIIQRKVEGRSVAATAICHAGRLIGAACYRPILEAGSVSIAFEREREAATAVTTWIETFIAAEALTGFVSFDFIVDDAGVPYAIECNPRATSAVHFFEPKSLAAAILAPHKAQTVEAGGAERQQQFYACLTEFWARIRSRTERAAVARALRTCRDVTWRRDDPLPFLTMTPTSWEILRIAMAQGVSLGEAATQDIGWFGRQAETEGGLEPVASDVSQSSGRKRL